MPTPVGLSSNVSSTWTVGSGGASARLAVSDAQLIRDAFRSGPGKHLPTPTRVLETWRPVAPTGPAIPTSKTDSEFAWDAAQLVRGQLLRAAQRGCPYPGGDGVQNANVVDVTAAFRAHYASVPPSVSQKLPFQNAAREALRQELATRGLELVSLRRTGPDVARSKVEAVVTDPVFFRHYARRDMDQFARLASTQPVVAHPLMQVVNQSDLGLNQRRDALLRKGLGLETPPDALKAAVNTTLAKLDSAAFDLTDGELARLLADLGIDPQLVASRLRLAPTEAGPVLDELVVKLSARAQALAAHPLIEGFDIRVSAAPGVDATRAPAQLRLVLEWLQEHDPERFAAIQQNTRHIQLMPAEKSTAVAFIYDGKPGLTFLNWPPPLPVVGRGGSEGKALLASTLGHENDHLAFIQDPRRPYLSSGGELPENDALAFVNSRKPFAYMMEARAYTNQVADLVNWAEMPNSRAQGAAVCSSALLRLKRANLALEALERPAGQACLTEFPGGGQAVVAELRARWDEVNAQCQQATFGLTKEERKQITTAIAASPRDA